MSAPKRKTVARQWLVKVEAGRNYEFLVYARTERGAQRVALRSLRGRRAYAWTSHAMVLEQVSGPWLAKAEWYGLTKDILLISRALGHRFTSAEIEVIAIRLNALGLRVIDYWNTNSAPTSFECVGRKGTEPLTRKQRSVVLAPLSDAEKAFIALKGETP